VVTLGDQNARVPALAPEVGEVAVVALALEADRLASRNWSLPSLPWLRDMATSGSARSAIDHGGLGEVQRRLDRLDHSVGLPPAACNGIVERVGYQQDVPASGW